MTELYSYSFGNFPILGKDCTELWLEIEQMFLDPRVSSIYFIQPSEILILIEQMCIFLQLDIYKPDEQIFPLKKKCLT